MQPIVTTKPLENVEVQGLKLKEKLVQNRSESEESSFLLESVLKQVRVPTSNFMAICI